MRRAFLTLPVHIRGLWVVAGASLLMAVACLIQAWRRPVTAISGVAPFSDTVDVATGWIVHAPSGKYARIDLQPGDQIVRFDRLSWEHTQRLNLHELSDKSVGAVIDLVVQRGVQTVSLQLPVTLPNGWEQLVLMRYGIAALLLSITPIFLLITLSKDILRRRDTTRTLAIDRSGIPLWFLTWQAIAIAQSIGSLKYPVAFLWTDVLTPILIILAGISSLPYPLAPRTLRPRWVERPLLLLAIGAATAILWHAWQSPFPAADWRRQVQLLRPTDPTWQWVLVPILIGVCCAIVGIFTTALSLPITRLLQTSEHRAPVRLRPQIRSLVHWFEAVYNQCPTSIRIIAEFQVMIVLVYLGFDLTPRVLGSGVGGGYSVLFAAIPFSYLLLYSDTQAQHQGRWLTRLLLLGVAGIQLPNLAYRFLTGNYGTGANASDLATLVLVAIGTIGGGVWIGFGQWRRRRRHLINPAQEAIDHLFEKETQATFWCHLTNEVGRHVGVHQWLWIVRQLMHEAPATTGEWQIISQTARTRSEWLVDPGLQSALTRLSQARTSSVVVDTTELPSTLVLLPIYRNDLLGEVLIAVNPQWVSGELPVEHTVLLSRLMQAITLLRNREREHYLLAQQTQIAEQRGQINEAYRQLTRMQREQTFRENLRFSTLLHDHTLQQLAALTQHLQEQQAASLMPAQRQTLAALEQQCRTINRELRQIASELRPPGVGQALRYSLEQAVMTWEQHHHTIQFDYSFAANEASLDEFQRDSVYMLVEQLVENALKHAAATAIIISVRQEEQSLIVEVSDNGRGFSYDPTQIRSDALGLLLRQDIAHELGATLTIDTRPGAGCHVTLVMPYSAAESA